MSGTINLLCDFDILLPISHLCTSQCKPPPPPNREGAGDLAGKMVSFDCKYCMSPIMGDIFSFGRQCGDESGGMDSVVNIYILCCCFNFLYKKSLNTIT